MSPATVLKKACRLRRPVGLQREADQAQEIFDHVSCLICRGQ